MKISVNNIKLFTLSEIQKKVMANEIRSEIFDADLKRRLKWVLMHKYEQCFDKLKKEWMPKLEVNGVKSIPLDKDALAELIFAQPNYKNRSKRELEVK